MRARLAGRYWGCDFDEEVTEVGGGRTTRRAALPALLVLDDGCDLSRWASGQPGGAELLRDFLEDYTAFCTLAPLLVAACTRVVTLQLITGIAPDQPETHAAAFADLRRAAHNLEVRGRLTGLVARESHAVAAALLERMAGLRSPAQRELADFLAERRRAHTEAGAAADAEAGWPKEDPAGEVFEGPLERLLTSLGALRERLAIALALEALFARSPALRRARETYERAEAWLAEGDGAQDGSIDQLFQAVTWLQVYGRSLVDVGLWSAHEQRWLAPLRTLARD